MPARKPKELSDEEARSPFKSRRRALELELQQERANRVGATGDDVVARIDGRITELEGALDELDKEIGD